ncbi:hypothetical protein CROQUDRAFT_101945 [Cronartium quercuum f. sp. fusiforme G11]|uniref:Uncharacterized protein n=1 Tax=Cronartium quercuum f. sp. fusiforme G11 TaxID=708437 RepID=A0A9P6N5J5_9BASI|nr:hypothetical protein CROQUDRAFT_101945 [Cronartium quercuum f. sp. fusiforme G11]
MLGAEDVGNVGAILQEVIKMLKNLPTGGYQGLNTSVRAAEITATPAGSFWCDKVAFHNAVTLAKHGLRVLAQAELQPSLPPDTLLATVLAGVQAIEAKVNALMLDSANRNPAPLPPKGPTFAQAAQKGTASGKTHNRPMATPKAPPRPPLPAKFPSLSLIQSSTDKDAYVKMNSEAAMLREKINCTLARALLACHPTGPPNVQIWALAHNRFTGEIQIQLHSQEDISAIEALPDQGWVADVNPQLRLKVQIFPIIVHGVPTVFNPANPHHLQELMGENVGVLDTLQCALWLNQSSILAKKTHSSIILHLTNPHHANLAI